ncbi:RNA 2',3'-cyclic phosphodiesterase [Aquibacillus saliphilus]|uniref:RNA 2',3'-cyclic phosphodiesterase n=1 Tax=Aquibacillus saliphilus TaxID=1909422 RepID=UPI001CF0B704|nr:RNA 2',3'-cyclic phosphodiesterase [Aquibacillus saliphilus]
MSQNQHYFIAVPIKNSTQQWLRNWQSQLIEASNFSYKSWTDPEDLHVTLKFLGPVSKDTVIQLSNNLEQNVQMSNFNLTIGRLGTFGNPNKPRVLWAGVEDNEHLKQLFHEVENTCVDFGFNKENRRYHPHITLAKKWNGQIIDSSTLSEIVTSYKEVKEIKVDCFVIYLIHPSKTPKYEVVKEIKFS